MILYRSLHITSKVLLQDSEIMLELRLSNFAGIPFADVIVKYNAFSFSFFELNQLLIFLLRDKQGYYSRNKKSYQSTRYSPFSGLEKFEDLKS